MSGRVDVPAGGFAARRVARRYEPTLAMPIYAVVTLFMAIGAINSQNNLLFWAFGVALAIMVISGIVSGPALSGLELQRRVAPAARAGEACRVRYQLTQRSRLSPMFAIEIEEVSADLGGDRIACSVAHVGSRSSVIVAAVWTPSRRGLVRLERVAVSSSFPFGLMRKVIVFEQAAVVRVGPQAVAMRPGVVGRRPASPRVTEKTRSRAGIGAEFFALRDYTAGDSPRLIAWRASARTGSLVIRQTSADAAPRMAVMLEAPGEISLEDGYLWERAIAMAYAVVAQAGSSGWRVVVGLPGGRHVRRLGDGGAGRRGLLLDLAELPEAGSESLALAQSMRWPDAESVVTIRARGGDTGHTSGVALCADDPAAWLLAGTAMPASLDPQIREGGRARRALWRGFDALKLGARSVRTGSRGVDGA